jgi:hypothetical protein
MTTFIVHSVGQFIAWSYADSPVHSSSSMRVLWNILATPLFHVSGSFADHYFWPIAIANSVLWAAILTYVIARFALRNR